MKERSFRVVLALPVLALILSGAPVATGQMTSGRGMKSFTEVFKFDPDTRIPDIQVVLLETSTPLAIYYPGEQPELTLQFQNRTNRPIKAEGHFDFYHFGTKGIPGDVWVPEVVLFDTFEPIPVTVDLAPNGWQNIKVKPQLPAKMGGYGLVLDLGQYGRDFVIGFARAYRPTTERVQYPKQSLDGMEPAYLERLGVQAIRFGWSYMHSKQPGFAEHLERLRQEMAEMQKHRVTVVMEFGGGRYDRVFGGKGSWARLHLDEEDNQIGGKGDMVWMPKDDDDFEEFVYQIACEYGWPKGPITGFMLWNEPWEGLSISGWGADLIRYRTIYAHIGQATERAGKDANVDLLVGGCDSSSNTWDKLFPDDSDRFMKYFDFCSIHYQGMSSPCLYRTWRERKEHKGRVLIWDTESWVANTDDRIAGVIATNRAAGYDRSLGVFFGYLTTAMSHGRKRWASVHREDGTVEGRYAQPEYSWPAAAAFLAAQQYIGERDFREILFKKGLPWVYVFDGLKGNPDDGTVVVVGDIGQLFQPDRVLYRSVRSLAEISPEATKQRLELEKQIREGTDGRARRQLETELKGLNTRHGGKLIVEAGDAPFRLFDFYGNPVEARQGKIEIPLDTRGYFLRADPARKGSFAELVEAVRTATITGLEPVELIPLDLLARVPDKPALRVNVANILNRPVRGKLSLEMAGLKLEYEPALALAPYESKQVQARVVEGEERPDNGYPLKLAFDAGPDGLSVHEDTMRVNLIHRRSITVDGNLEDWSNALPQIIQTDEAATRTFTESAWLPFEDLKAEDAGGFAAGFVAYDDQHFYFAAKIADPTPHPGTLRYEARNDDEFFYPPVAYHTKTDQYGMPIERIELRWPEGLRRFSYRKHPTLPSAGQGEPFDNVLLAFNAIPFDQEESWITHLPGRMPKFVFYKCTDYEYALNMVAPKYGGGFEVWRLDVPGLPRKHFYPRQPKHPLEGAVKAAKLVTVYRGGARYTEAAIPWEEIPHVKKLLDAGQTVKFSYRVNHDTRGPCMELARERSVSRVNPRAFHVDWNEHWANELEFAFER